MVLWRCVNCGDYVDCNILANRGKASGSARERARPSDRGPQRTRLLRWCESADDSVSGSYIQQCRKVVDRESA